ncbi:hypothetical protein [Pontibacter harenae]|uniref:hypothetical protein n=1 Tax=Pontibacter harenae TaxID=2894083 RepID=UPI001E3A11D1|nr:hypothetical protein [Pontibacter harenae]MCC9168891.1 hypothetical protein [Pontibacter harenae]
MAKIISKEPLIEDEDVQVLHDFNTAEEAQAYRSNTLFLNDVVVALKPYLKDTPKVRVYIVVL